MADSVRVRLANAISLAPQRADALLLHLGRVLSSAAGVDSTLCTICYALTLLHSQLVQILAARYQRLVTTLISKSSASDPSRVALAIALEPPTSSLSETCAGIKALADMIADFRIFVRLWGLLDVFKAVREVYTRPPWDPIIKTLLWAQLAAYAIFQYLENGAYLASNGVLRGKAWARRGPKWDLWSNRFWMAQVLLEMLRLLRVRQLKYNEDFGAEASDVVEKQIKIESKELEQRWHRSFYANAGWFPLTLHWSFEDQSRSPVSETWIGLCGMIPGIIAFGDEWERTI